MEKVTGRCFHEVLSRLISQTGKESEWGFLGKEGGGVVIEQRSEPEPDVKRPEKKQKGERKANVIIITVGKLSLYQNHCRPRKSSKTEGSPWYSPEMGNFHLLYGPSV